MGGWNVGRVFGIPVRLHWSLLLLGAFIGFTYGQGALGALLGAALLFASVVAHEVAHALVARGYGIETRDIVLTPIGGIARLEGMPESGRAEAVIALAGPAMSLALAGLAWSASLFVPGGFGASLLASLAWTNGMLGVFNLIPAFPMDGGRVLRGALQERIGVRAATSLAANVGRVAAIAMCLFGLFTGSWSLVFIALFVWSAGSRERAMVEEREAWARRPQAWDAWNRPIEVEMIPSPWEQRRRVVIHR
jgi:Zn-dependent protease